MSSRHPTSDSRWTLVFARLAILLGPLASVVYGLDVAERQGSIEEYAERLQFWILVVKAPLFLALVMPAVLIVRRLWTTSTPRALTRRGGIALALPLGWIVYATASQKWAISEGGISMNGSSSRLRSCRVSSS